MDGAYHVVEPHEVSPPYNAEHHSAEERPHEPFHRLLRRERDEWGMANRDTPDVSEDVITND